MTVRTAEERVALTLRKNKPVLYVSWGGWWVFQPCRSWTLNRLAQTWCQTVNDARRRRIEPGYTP